MGVFKKIKIKKFVKDARKNGWGYRDSLESKWAHSLVGRLFYNRSKRNELRYGKHVGKIHDAKDEFKRNIGLLGLAAGTIGAGVLGAYGAKKFIADPIYRKHHPIRAVGKDLSRGANAMIANNSRALVRKMATTKFV